MSKHYKKTNKPSRLWMRTGDACEYEGYDSVAAAASALKDYLGSWERTVTKGDISFTRGGMFIKGLFEGNNYVSLYWGVTAEGIVSPMTPLEENEFESRLLGLGWEHDRPVEFAQPKGDTPLARAMSIPWVAEGIKPEVQDDGAGGMESKKLLLWVKGYGPEFGKLIKGSRTGNLKWIIHGYRGDFTVTHWAYITEPK